MNVKAKLEQARRIEQEIYEYFKYEERWTVYPITDDTQYWWQVSDGCVHFWDKKPEKEDLDEPMYSHEILTKGVFPGKDFTAILVDTCTDGNKFFAIYDNAKRVG